MCVYIYTCKLVNMLDMVSGLLYCVCDKSSLYKDKIFKKSLSLLIHIVDSWDGVA